MAEFIQTPEFLMSFPYLITAQMPRPNKDGSPSGKKAKYSVVMLFEKGEDLSALKKLVQDYAIEKFGPDKAKWPKLKLPFRDQADRLEGPKPLAGYVAGAIFATPTSERRPPVVGPDARTIITNEADIYAGCYGRAFVNVFYYKVEGNQGLSFGLQMVQKTRDGEPLAGGVSIDAALAAFEPVGDVSETKDSTGLFD